MNRKQRRAAGIKTAPVRDPVIPMHASDIERIKQTAVESAMVLIMGMPLKVLRERYGWGVKKRLPEFTEYMLSEYASFQDGAMNLEEYRDLIYEYCGVKFVLTGETE